MTHVVRSGFGGEAWAQAVDELERELKERLVAVGEFDAMLGGLLRRRGAPLVAVEAEFQSPDPLPSVTVGNRGVAGPDASDTWPLDESRVFAVKTELWYAEGANAEHEAGREAIRRLMLAWWRGEGRNEKSGLLSGQMPATQRAVEESLRHWLLAGRVVVSFADIDDFKRFNDTRGYAAGDTLIRRLGASLMQAATRTSLVVHLSGDEFLVLAPGARPGNVVADAMDLREEIERVVRDGVDVDPPGFSMGIAVCDVPMEYRTLEQLAEKALKPGGVKRKGRVSIAEPGEGPRSPGADAIECQLVLALNLLESEEPFKDPWLDAASVSGARACAAAANVADLSERLAAVLVRFIDERDAGQAAVVVACAHGVARSLLRGSSPPELTTLRVRVDQSAAMIVDGQSDAILAGTSPAAEAREVVIQADNVGEEIDSRRAILVKIGDGDLGLPSELFAATVFVDDRPTIGGGLPDFWEAAISQIVACVGRHPNVDRILLTGNLEMGRQTVRRLREAGRWSEPEYGEALSNRLGQSRSRIAQAGARIEGRIAEVTTGADAIAVLLGDLAEAGRLLPPSAADPAPQPPRLRRALSMEDMLPGPEYGCRVATAADAFPVALDIVRQIEDGALEDQTGRLFRELVDFRIQLSQPQQDRLPRFYREDQELLNEYFDREFLNQNGLFRAALDKHGQIEAVVAHVAEIVATRRLTSRRALLVVPHEPEPGADLSPLGLVSVRIIPRPVARRTVRLDYSFSWRTVEALVGLPYSLFGSIMFAEHITSLVSAKLRPADPQVSMGTLSYIAHSLHMFVDEYADQVARRIVNDDSL